MEHDILYYHKQLQEQIHAVERDENDREALDALRQTFYRMFDMIKMIMISKQERYYGLFLMNFDLRIDFAAYSEASVSIDAFPFRMTVNPLLIGLKSLPEMIYIFCHEIEHIILNHPVDGIRYNPKRDPEIGCKLNVAMDTSINDRLTQDSKADPHSVISEPETAITSARLNELLGVHMKHLQAFDYYFERIPDLKGDAGKPIRIVFVGEQSDQTIMTEEKRKNIICLPCWTQSDDPDEVAGIIHRFVSDVCDGMSETMRGLLPGHQKQVLDKLLQPPVITWKRLLKRYIGTIVHGHRKTRMRLSRRQPERYDVSGCLQDRLIKLVVAIDTSGSMSVETLQRIMAEIFDMIGTRMCEVTIIECDAQIQRVYKACSVKDISYDIQGRGGTSFLPVIEYVNSNRYFSDAILIYFTDGMANRWIPKPRTRRIMWVLHDERCELSVKEPYGEVLIMD